MNKIYSMLLIITALIAGTQKASCQQAMPGDAAGITHIQQLLSLSPKQAIEVWQVMKAHRNSTDSLVNTSVRPDRMQRVFNKHMIEYKNKLNALLTPAQQQQLAAAIASEIDEKRRARLDKLAAIKSDELKGAKTVSPPVTN